MSARPGTIRLVDVRAARAPRLGTRSAVRQRSHAARSAGDRPTGHARLLPTADRSGRVYLCDPVHHCIDVVDDQARSLFSFGGFGSAPGQFNEPTDVLIVPGDEEPGGRDGDFPILAVADRNNHRVQLFELDGSLLTTLDPWHVRGMRPSPKSFPGSPFFRVEPVPQLVRPSRLEWRRPFLDVVTAAGVVVPLDVDMLRLPDFESWLVAASPLVARRALDHFRREGQWKRIPDRVMSRIADRTAAHLTLVRGNRAAREER